MTYPEWTDAVNQALSAAGKPFTALQIDPAQLSSAFHAGQSPVLFARTAVSMPPQSQPVQPAPYSPPAIAPRYAGYKDYWLQIVRGSLVLLGIVFVTVSIFQLGESLMRISRLASANVQTNGDAAASEIAYRTIIFPQLAFSFILGFCALAAFAFERMLRLLDLIEAKL